VEQSAQVLHTELEDLQQLLQDYRASVLRRGSAAQHVRHRLAS
jgi:hypothetical protein